MEKTPLVFFGSSKMVIPILEILIKDFELKLVVTTEKNSLDAVPSFCRENNISYISIQHFSKETIHQLQSFHVSVAVLADFGLIIPDVVLSLFPKGIINIHPSLLPKFRGPTPVQSALLEKKNETGVTIIKLDDKVDHGPILVQEKASIEGFDTSESLHLKLFTRGADLLTNILPTYLNGNLVPQPQDDTKATFTQKLNRNSGYIDLSKETTNSLQRKIRAFYPWPGAWTRIQIRNQEMRIKFLPENKLQIEGKKPQNYKDFLNGYPEMKEWVEKLG